MMVERWSAQALNKKGYAGKVDLPLEL